MSDFWTLILFLNMIISPYFWRGGVVVSGAQVEEVLCPKFAKP